MQMRIMQDKMKTNKVRITLGSWSGVIALDRGACLESLRNEDYGVSILREPPANGELDNPYLYGMPILFPANRIENGKFEFEGRIYSFPVNEPATNCHLHGMLHETPFELVEKSDSSVVCRYRAEKGEYLDFPHAFEIIERYELVTEGLLHTVTVTNLSEDNMPVFLAFHTRIYLYLVFSNSNSKCYEPSLTVAASHSMYNFALIH